MSMTEVLEELTRLIESNNIVKSSIRIKKTIERPKSNDDIKGYNIPINWKTLFEQGE